MNGLLRIMIYTGIILVIIIFLVIRRRIFKKREKEIKERKNYLSHLNELFEEHDNYVSMVDLGVIILLIFIFILIMEVIRYYM